MTYRLNQLQLSNHCSQAVNLSNSIKDIIYPLNLLPSHKFNFDTHVTPRCHCTWNTIKNHETMRFHVEIDMATRSEPIKVSASNSPGTRQRTTTHKGRPQASRRTWNEQIQSVFSESYPQLFHIFFHFKFDSSSSAFESSNSLAFTILVEQLPTKQAKHN